MAYDSQKFTILETFGIIVYDQTNEFEKLAKWCKTTFKDESKWTVITTIYENTYTGLLKKGFTKIAKSIETHKKIRFHNKEDFVFYKLTWK